MFFGVFSIWRRRQYAIIHERAHAHVAILHRFFQLIRLHSHGVDLKSVNDSKSKRIHWDTPPRHNTHIIAERLEELLKIGTKVRALMIERIAGLTVVQQGRQNLGHFLRLKHRQRVDIVQCGVPKARRCR